MHSGCILYFECYYQYKMHYKNTFCVCEPAKKVGMRCICQLPLSVDFSYKSVFTVCTQIIGATLTLG